MSAAASSPHVMNTYGRMPLALSHGQGCRVWDTDGKEYLDALGGIAVNTLGHNHAELVPALQEQLGKIIHSSNYYHIPLQEQLAATPENLALKGRGTAVRSAALSLVASTPAWVDCRTRIRLPRTAAPMSSII